MLHVVPASLILSKNSSHSVPCDRHVCFYYFHFLNLLQLKCVFVVVDNSRLITEWLWNSPSFSVIHFDLAPFFPLVLSSAQKYLWCCGMVSSSVSLFLAFLWPSLSASSSQDFCFSSHDQYSLSSFCVFVKLQNLLKDFHCFLASRW